MPTCHLRRVIRSASGRVIKTIDRQGDAPIDVDLSAIGSAVDAKDERDRDVEVVRDRQLERRPETQLWSLAARPLGQVERDRLGAPEEGD